MLTDDPRSWSGSRHVDVGELILDRGVAAPVSRPRRTQARGHDPSRRSFGRRLLSGIRTLLALASACALGVLLVAPLGWKEQALAGGALIAAAILLSGLSRSRTVTLALMAVSIFSTLRYAYWRVGETWNGITSAGHLYEWDTVFVLLLLGAEFYAFATLALGYFQTLHPLRRPPVPLRGDPHAWPTVDVFIPTYNEPLDVVRATVLGALQLDYPADKINIYVLDDGRRREFKDWTAHVGVGYITRGNNAHAKAGNINHALGHTRGKFVAIFDCDHVPTRSFLQATLGWFARDQMLGLVQTPHHFYSPDPFERNLAQFRKVPNEGALFHRLVQDGNDLWNASFFCGSCAVIRRVALEEIGGIAVETVTEDAHTALRMQRRGWNTAYINIPQAAGLATESLSAHIGQRIRWARGMVQILRIENPLLASGLSFTQRLCYFNATTHYLFAVPRLVFLTIPLTYLLFGMVNIYGYSLAVFAYALPHLVLSQLANARVQKGYRSSLWNEVYEAVLAPYILLPTLLALINPRLGKFNVTAKGGVIERSYFDHRVALPFLLLLGLNIAGLVMAYQRYVTDPAHHDTLIMNAVWTVYNIVILSVAASVARERRQRRTDVRVDVRLPLTLVTPKGEYVAGVSAELSRGGVAACFTGTVRLSRHAPVTVVLHTRGAHCEIAARVVSWGRGRQVVHLQFDQLNTAQERFVVNAIYSRPAAWVESDAPGRTDSPLKSIGRILWLSLRGIVVVLFGLLTPPRRGTDTRTTKDRRRAAAAAASMLAIAVASAGPARAAQRPDEAAAVTPSMFRDTYELGEIAGQRATALQGPGASLNFHFGVPVTKIISEASLVLRYAAPLLEPGDGRLELLLNGSRIGSVALAPGTGVEVDVPLPTDLLTTDNTLSLRLEGRCAACPKASAPWVTIDPGSRLGIGGTRLPLANDLSLLPLPFFDASSRRAWRLPVVFSAPPELDEIRAAAVVASWFGVASDVRGVRFPVMIDALPEGHALVIARRGSALASMLSLPPTPATLVAIRDNPRDPYGKLLIVVADRPAELLEAARALVTLDLSRLQADVLPGQDVRVPDRGAYAAPRWLQNARPAPIGLYTTADRLKLVGSGSIDVFFRLPPDLFLPIRQSIPLVLQFAYAGVPEGSRAALHVRLNAEDVDTIRLEPSLGPVQREEIVRLPTGRLRPYANALTVDVDFGRYGAPSGVTQYAAIDRESAIDLRGVPHWVALPKLELFVDAGYPFTAWPDLSRTAIVLSNAPTPIEYEVLLNMVAFFSAQTGSPATAISIANAADVETVRDKDLVLLGTPSTQPWLEAWVRQMPLGLSIDGPRLHDDGPLLNRVRRPDFWLRPQWPFRDEGRNRLSRLIERGEQLDVVLEQFVSPFRPDRSVVAIVLGEGGGELVSSLFAGIRSGPIYGGLAVAHDGRFEAFPLGIQPYHAGDVDPYQRAQVFLVEHYLFIPLFVLLVALLVGSGVRDAAERVSARRLMPARTREGWST
jgi:cellulose synthase (UDP-forming)